MAKIEHLSTILSKEGVEYTKNLLKKTVYLAEKLDGISFNMAKKDGELVFFKKNLNSPLRLLDRVIISLYEKPIQLFNSLPDKIKNIIPENFLFTFEYFPNNKPINIKYDYTPKNNLVLTNVINPKDDKLFLDLQDWAKLFGVDWVEFLNRDFESSEKVKVYSLNDNQVDSIINMINSSDIKTQIYELFPRRNKIEKNTLHSDTTKMIEGFVFFTKDKKYPFIKLITKEYFDTFIKNRKEKIQNRKSEDLVNLLIIDFTNFYTSGKCSEFIKNLIIPEKIKKSADLDNIYLFVMSILFSKYMEENRTRWVGTVFQKPSFANSPEFNLNTNLITNKKALKILNTVDNAKDIFKILLSYFKKLKVKVSDDSLINSSNGTMIKGLMTLIQSKVKECEFEKIIEPANKDNSNSIDFNLIDPTVMEGGNIKVNKDFLLELLYYRYGENLTLEDFAELTSTNYSPVGTSIGSFNIGNSPVNIFPGRFQPFHNGHLKVIKKMYKKNSKPTVLVVINPGDKEHTFNQELHSNIFKDLMKNHEEIKDVVFTKKGWIKDILSTLRDKNYEPELWGYGDDRKNNYSLQIADWAKKLNSKVSGYHVSRQDDNISSTEIKNKLMAGDIEYVKEKLPSEVAKYLSYIKNILEK